MDVNQLFPWFSTHSDREGSLIAEQRAKTYKIKRRQLFKLFFIGWRITLLKRVLCEQSEVAKTFSKVYVTVSQVVYLFDCMKTWERWMNCQEATINSKKRKISHQKGKKFPLNGGCFWKWLWLLIILHVIKYRVSQKFVPLLQKSVFQYDWTW